MMGRHPGFYSPLHSMWGTAFGTTSTASAKQYTGFSYPQNEQKDNNSSDQTNNNNNSDEVYTSSPSNTPLQQQSSPMDFKAPSSDQLMQAYGTGNMLHNSNRKMPEGTASATTMTTSHQQHQSPAMSYYYYASQDLASMYGAGSFSASGKSSLARPKQKTRSNNAGKKCKVRT